MAEPTENRRITFPEQYGKILDLKSIGYYDSRIGDGKKLVQLKVDHTFHYIRGGSGVLIAGGRTYQLKAGDLFYVPPDTPVVYYRDDSDMWRYYFFHLDGEFGARFAAMMELSAGAPVCTVEAHPAAAALFDRLLALDAPLPQLYDAALSALLQLLAASAWNTAVDKTVCVPADMVDSARKIIELNYKNPQFNIRDISEGLFISHSHLCRQFKQKLKATPISYMIALRLSHAAKLLQRQDMSVKNLSAAVGFSDELYFMKCFKRKFGMTVRAYRKQFEK